jgi:hypothetical protein
MLNHPLTVISFECFHDPYVISATTRDTLRRHAKEGRYQIHGSYTYQEITKMMNPIVMEYIV